MWSGLVKCLQVTYPRYPGLINNPLPVEINKRIIDPSYDLILSIGQVVPHELWEWPITQRHTGWLRR